MPKTKNPLNIFGRWLTDELAKRNLLNSEFAELVGITPQYLSNLMRMDTPSCINLLADWKNKSEDFFHKYDK